MNEYKEEEDQCVQGRREASGAECPARMNTDESINEYK